MEKGFSNNRKQRSDAGLSIFNLELKRKHTFTAFNTYKKRRYSEFRECPGYIKEERLKQDYTNLPQDEKDAFETLAERDLIRSRTLWDELKNLLLKTKGKIAYETMANELGSIVSGYTIRSYLKKQDGFISEKIES